VFTRLWLFDNCINLQATEQKMISRKLRLQRGWSQEQLAELSGLSVRTIQRIERGQKPGLESAKSLASVFEVDLSTFHTGESIVNDKIELKSDEREAMQYVKGIKEFYSHLLMYVIFAIFLLVFKGISDPLIVWGLAGWGVGVVIHGLVAFEKINFIGQNWEKNQIEKRLDRKL
jgi:transcriptional regulator with XRE-family HTH domain